MLLLITLLMGLELYCFNTAFYVKRKRKNDIYDVPSSAQYLPYKQEMLDLITKLNNYPYEAVHIQSFDGLTLRGRLYMMNGEDAPLDIAFNGYRSSGVRDCGGVFQLVKKAGHNMLVVDQRATGESDGHVISFGVNERFDVLSWVNYVNKRFNKKNKIILLGGSMGAATVLMSANLNLPSNVVGIAADSGYTSPKAIIKKVMKSNNLPSNVLYPFVKNAAKYLGHFDLEGASAFEALKHTTIPVLLIHGQADHYVPCYMAKENYEVCTSPLKILLTVPNGPHDISLLIDWNKYENTLFDFYNRIGVMNKK